MFCSFTANGGTVQFTFNTDTISVQAGHVRLEWHTSSDTIFELQQAADASFAGARVIYRGPDRASFISGLEDGTYVYRVRATDGEWSDPLTIIVKHQSIRLAKLLFGIGAVVFLLTVAVVVHGTWQTKHETL